MTGVISIDIRNKRGLRIRKRYVERPTSSYTICRHESYATINRGIRLNNSLSIVRGTIVNNDHLPVLESLCSNTLDDSSNRLCPILDRTNYTNGWYLTMHYTDILRRNGYPAPSFATGRPSLVNS